MRLRSLWTRLAALLGPYVASSRPVASHVSTTNRPKPPNPPARPPIPLKAFDLMLVSDWSETPCTAEGALMSSSSGRLRRNSRISSSPVSHGIPVCKLQMTAGYRIKVVALDLKEGC